MRNELIKIISECIKVSSQIAKSSDTNLEKIQKRKLVLGNSYQQICDLFNIDVLEQLLQEKENYITNVLDPQKRNVSANAMVDLVLKLKKKE